MYFPIMFFGLFLPIPRPRPPRYGKLFLIKLSLSLSLSLLPFPAYYTFFYYVFLPISTYSCLLCIFLLCIVAYFYLFLPLSPYSYLLLPNPRIPKSTLYSFRKALSIAPVYNKYKLYSARV